MNNNTDDNPSTPHKNITIDSQYFTQLMQSTPQLQNVDKGQLFETFLIFQNFLNLKKNSQNPNDNTNNNINFQEGTSNNTLPDTISPSTLQIPDSNTLNSPQDKINDTNVVITTEPLEKKELIYLSTEKNEEEDNKDDKDSKNDKEDIKNKEEQNNIIKPNNYDEIPIKISNTNFLEMVEKKLASDGNALSNGIQNDNNNNFNSNDDNPKRKIVKSQRNKKILNISKPSKKDKKYSYYTDFLQDKNQSKPQNTSSTFPKKKQQNQSTTKNNQPSSSNQQQILLSLPEEPQQTEDTKCFQPQQSIKLLTTSSMVDIEYDDIDLALIDSEPKENQLSQPIKLNHSLIGNNNNNNNNNSMNTTNMNKEQQVDLQIKQLNTEIMKFKEERKKVFALKSEYEKLHLRLQEELEQLNIKKNEFETYKDSEHKKMQKKEKAIAVEVKLCNHIKLQNHTLATTSKKDKEQIEILKTQIKTMQNEFKQKEINNKIIIDKLKKQNEELKKQLQLSKMYNSNITTSHNNNNINTDIYGEYIDNKPIQHKSKTENKFFLQQYDDEEELRISRGINEHMINNDNDNITTHYQYISNVDNNFTNEEEPKIEFTKLSAKNSFISGDCYSSNYNINNNHTKKTSIHHSPIASPKSKKDIKLKARKLIHKHSTSSSVNNNTRTNTNNNNSTRGMCLSKDKINNNNKLSTKRNLNTSNKSAETHYKKASNASDRNTLSSSLPLKPKAPFSAKTKKNKTIHNNSSSNMTMLSYNSSNPGISRSTKNSSNNLPQSIELKKHIYNHQQHQQAQPHHNNISNIINSIDNNNNDECYDFYFPEEYSNQSKYSLIKTLTTSEGKTVNVYTNNKKEVIFPSGVRKEIYNNNHQIVYFTNGDLKQIFPNGKSVYYFKEAQTVQTSFEDGLQVFKFQGGQIEKHYPDGTKQITFPDGSMKYMMNDGYEEAHYNDGSVQIIDKEGTIIYELPDGTKEIKYADGKEEYIYPKDNFKNRKNN